MGQVPQVVTNEPKATVVSDGTDGTDEIVVLIDDEGQVAHEPGMITCQDIFLFLYNSCRSVLGFRNMLSYRCPLTSKLQNRL